MNKFKVMPYGGLRAEMHRQFFAYKEFGAALGISAASLSDRLSGKRQWRLSEIYDALRILGVAPERIYEFFPDERGKKRGASA